MASRYGHLIYTLLYKVINVKLVTPLIGLLCIWNNLCVEPHCLKMIFFQRCISTWNDLPKNVVEATSVKCFKDMLNKVDLSKYLKFNF